MWGLCQLLRLKSLESSLVPKVVGLGVPAQVNYTLFQDLSEKGKICMLVGLEQPPYCGQEGCLD